MKSLVFMLGILLLNLCACSNLGNTTQMDNSFDFLQPDAGTVIQPANIKQEISIDSKEYENASELYNQFLNGDINIESIGNIDDITVPTGEPDRRFRTEYAYQDSSGDGIPELHINSGRYYTIISYRDDELFVWKSLNPYPYYYGLKDGAFMSYDARQSFVYYRYFILNYSGDTIFEVSFSKNEKERYQVLDKIDEYTFDGVTVTKEIWEGLTERYLYTDEEGIERVRNEIEWTVLFEDTK